MNDTTYAPQSPDLSFLADDDKSSSNEPYRPRSPRIPERIPDRIPAGPLLPPSHPPTTSQYTPSYNQIAYEAQYPPIPPLPTAHSQFGVGSYQQGPPIHSPTKQPTSQYNSFSAPLYNQPPPTYYQPLPASSTFQQTQSTPIPIKQENLNKQPFQPSINNAYPTPDNSYPSYASPTGNTMAQQAAGSSGVKGNGLGPSQGIEIKTKFPVARIKRIMQADEEVGKVAQVTPVAVCKSSSLPMHHSFRRRKH